MTQSNSWETRRHDARIGENADQTEFSALSYGKTNLEAGTFDDRIAAALDDYEVSDPISVPPWANSDLVFDNAVSDIGIELRRRASVLQDNYPFSLDGNQLIYKSSSTLVYELCLAISQAQSLNQGDFKKLPVAFERLMKDLMVWFIGENTQGMRTGWPPDEDRPTKFKELVSKLNNLTGEWIWSPDFGLPDDPTHQQVKDEGLDFVVWKDVGDNRAGKLFFLGQCACGNDWESKFHDIDAEFAKLAKWLNPISFAKPSRLFCVPRHIPNDKYFAQVNREAGLTLDRSRISLLASRAGEWLTEEEVRDKFQSLIKIVISGFEVV
jgi:hypothetical protein